MPKLYRYGALVSTHDLLKAAAVLLMCIDHFGRYCLVPEVAEPYRLVGRFAAPCFFFLIGYTNRLRITPALLAYGALLSLVISVSKQQLWVNILLTFVVIQWSLWRYPPEQMSFLVKVGGCCVSVWFTVFLNTYVEYGGLGIMIAYAARLCALGDKEADPWLFCALGLYFLWQAIVFDFCENWKVIFLLFSFGICLFLILRRYRKVFLFEKGFFKTGLLIVSRYSLEIYFVHVLLLECIEYGIKYI